MCFLNFFIYSFNSFKFCFKSDDNLFSNKLKTKKRFWNKTIKKNSFLNKLFGIKQRSFILL